MTTSKKNQLNLGAVAWRKRLGSFRKDTDGATAIEFALVAIPFFMLVFGIMAIGMHFFTSNALEHGVETAARQIRTGQAQNGDMSLNHFKQAICDETSGYVNCDDLTVHVQSGANWADIDPQPCAEGGNIAPSAGAGTDLVSGQSGGAGQVVLVTACYEFKLGQAFPIGLLGGLAQDSALIQAVSTFRTEPFAEDS